jgi:hypothetical protein
MQLEFLEGRDYLDAPERRDSRRLDVSPILVSWTSGRAQSAQNTKAVQLEVSAAEIGRTLRAIDVDRTSGSNGERAVERLTGPGHPFP